jgi:hypothetical protein
VLLVMLATPLQAQLSPPEQAAEPIEVPAAVKTGTVSPAAPEATPKGNVVDGFPVVLDGKTLFLVRVGVPGLVSAEERASVINQRLQKVANDPKISPESIRVEEQDGITVVMAGEMVLLTISEADVEAYGESAQALGENTADFLQTAVAQYREARSLRPGRGT